jgi:hypothetical protein
MHENRETSRAARFSRDRGRSEKMQNRTSDVYALEESDHAILPMNQSEQRGATSQRTLGREGRGPRRTSFDLTRARHTVENPPAQTLVAMAPTGSTR